MIFAIVIAVTAVMIPRVGEEVEISLAVASARNAIDALCSACSRGLLVRLGDLTIAIPSGFEARLSELRYEYAQNDTVIIGAIIDVPEYANTTVQTVLRDLAKESALRSIARSLNGERSGDLVICSYNKYRVLVTTRSAS